MRRVGLLGPVTKVKKKKKKGFWKGVGVRQILGVAMVCALAADARGARGTALARPALGILENRAFGGFPLESGTL